MSEELKPCPFCPDGGEPEINYGCGGSKAYVRCHGCGIFSPSFDKKKDAVAYWNTRAERTTQNVTDAWNDWGVNVFNDDELDDFGRFEKIYKVCQEIVEPIEFTCHVMELGGLQGRIPLLLCRACGEQNYARADGSAWDYCPSCGSKVIRNAD